MRWTKGPNQKWTDEEFKEICEGLEKQYGKYQGPLCAICNDPAEDTTFGFLCALGCIEKVEGFAYKEDKDQDMIKFLENIRKISIRRGWKE